jgi:cardiolipin synthase
MSVVLWEPRSRPAESAGAGTATAAPARNTPDVATSAADTVDLLDGGAEAYPRMLAAIAGAKKSIHLEIYIFQATGVGALFLEALEAACRRGVAVRVVVDGWGSALTGRNIAARLREAGASVKIYNRILSMFLGRFRRNHKKILLVDDEIAFLGGINIGDEYAARYEEGGWADLAVEVRGPTCARLSAVISGRGRKPRRGERLAARSSPIRIYLSGARGGGRRLRRRYVRALSLAQREVLIAQGYFLPDRGLVRALIRAARRGVRVSLLLAGRTDVPFIRTATLSLYDRLLRAGVVIHEWTTSVLHAKAAVVDDARFLVGSFNLDPLSLSNEETLVEVDDPELAWQARGWIGAHIEGAQLVRRNDVRRSPWQRWFTDRIGLAIARAAELLGRLLNR